LNAMGMSPDQLKMFVSMAEGAYRAGARKFQQFTDNINAQYGAMAKRSQGSFETMSPQTLWNAVQNFYKPLMASSNNGAFSASGGYGGLGNVMPGFHLPAMFADMVPPKLESTLSNAFNGYSIVNAGNPANFTASGILRAQGMNILGDALSSRPMWHGDGNIAGAMQTILSQPWANKNMSMMQMPSAMRLFGYRRGGKFKGKAPIQVGEEGTELIIPDGPGSVVPHRDVKAALAPNVNVQVINATGVEARATQTVMPDGTVKVFLNALTNMIADPGHALHRTVKQVARGA
jgi:hypothetical protein